MKLYYRTQGEGRPVLILHGLFGDGLNWGGVARLLKDDWRLILPDMRNHGRSPHSDDDCSYKSMAADVLALMDELALNQVDLIGHSMGGKIAMTLALMHPERISSLTVVDIAPKTYESRHEDVFDAIRAVHEARPSTRKQADELLKPHLETTAIRTFILKNLQKDDDGRFSWRMNWQALWEHYAQLKSFPWPAEGTDLPQYQGPVQFLVGGASDYVTKSDQTVISTFFPHARGRVVDNAGHWLHAEKPELVARWIQQFISRNN